MIHLEGIYSNRDMPVLLTLEQAKSCFEGLPKHTKLEVFIDIHSHPSFGINKIGNFYLYKPFVYAKKVNCFWKASDFFIDAICNNNQKYIQNIKIIGFDIKDYLDSIEHDKAKQIVIELAKRIHDFDVENNEKNPNLFTY